MMKKQTNRQRTIIQELFWYVQALYSLIIIKGRRQISWRLLKKQWPVQKSYFSSSLSPHKLSIFLKVEAQRVNAETIRLSQTIPCALILAHPLKMSVHQEVKGYRTYIFIEWCSWMTGANTPLSVNNIERMGPFMGRGDPRVTSMETKS